MRACESKRLRANPAESGVLVVEEKTLRLIRRVNDLKRCIYGIDG